MQGENIIKIKKIKDKKYHKIRDHCQYTGKYKIKCMWKNPTAFYNGSNFDYHFIIKELAEEFDKNYLFRRNSGKYMTFSVVIEKELGRIYKKGEEMTKNISHNYNLLIAQDLCQAHYQNSI